MPADRAPDPDAYDLVPDETAPPAPPPMPDDPVASPDVPDDTDEPTPDDEPVSEVVADPVVTAWLADRDVECPRCGYNLRGVGAPRCPECGEVIELTVHSRNKTFSGFNVGLAGLALSTFALFTHAFYAGMYLPFSGLVELGAAGLCGWATYQWSQLRERFDELPEKRQYLWVAATWVIVIAWLIFGVLLGG